MNTDDVVAIRALVDRYSDAANRCNTADMAATYAEDATLNALGNELSGRAAIQGAFDQTIPLMQVMNQVCSGGVVEVNGDRATARWNVTEFSKRHGKELIEMFLGNYEDEMIRTADGWRFSRRVLTRRLGARFEPAALKV